MTGEQAPVSRRAGASFPLCALYVPGSRPDRFDRAAASGADAVILDLEDSVAPADRPAARLAVARWLPTAPLPVQVRVGAPGSDDLAADLDALPHDVPLRLPKVSSPRDLDGLDRLDGLEGRVLHVLLESALGVEQAFAIASHPAVVSVALGEADLAAELGLDGDDAFTWVRSRAVVAARAAGLPAPLMSAYAALDDHEGLAASCRAGRRLGFRGRTAVHPAQVPVIRAAFAPTEAELAWARQVVAALEAGGVARLPDGSMVDAAMTRRAETLLGQG
jgi:citrate lyase subunit beta / citryl-CoA lyase